MNPFSTQLTFSIFCSLLLFLLEQIATRRPILARVKSSYQVRFLADTRDVLTVVSRCENKKTRTKKKSGFLPISLNEQ